uniref:Uncharacterized protein n=1 Tax=Rhizophora mucronata TaxID=61149 RepID=A0A2P2QRW7_RHIMU
MYLTAPYASFKDKNTQALTKVLYVTRNIFKSDNKCSRWSFALSSSHWWE